MTVRTVTFEQRLGDKRRAFWARKKWDVFCIALPALLLLELASVIYIKLRHPRLAAADPLGFCAVVFLFFVFCIVMSWLSAELAIATAMVARAERGNPTIQTDDENWLRRLARELKRRRKLLAFMGALTLSGAIWNKFGQNAWMALPLILGYLVVKIWHLVHLSADLTPQPISRMHRHHRTRLGPPAVPPRGPESVETGS